MISSWGKVNKINKIDQKLLSSMHFDANLIKQNADSLLVYGMGRSYGDVCLNSRGSLILNEKRNRIITFDEAIGLLTCESGITLGEILNFITEKKQWFLPVLPGTQYVTVGGAVANDIHGKNHIIRGSFGEHITRMVLVRSDLGEVVCSAHENSELFYATIGGIGLTGYIKEVTIQLMLASPWIFQELVPFYSLEEFFQIDEDSRHWEYTVSWLDLLDKKSCGRGVYIRGRHLLPGESPKSLDIPFLKSAKLFVPFDLPRWMINPFFMKIASSLYFNMQKLKPSPAIVPFGGFFFPLDNIRNWNRVYGTDGFFQYQGILESKELTIKLLKEVVASQQGSLLTVLKKFGTRSSGGYLSFPKCGYTFALDFANRGAVTRDLFKKLDRILEEGGGRLYTAKDAVMSPEQFSKFYPKLEQFKKQIDPKFNSDFWQRVQGSQRNG